MGLLDKTNPNATRRSVIRHAALGAIGVPAFFFALGKPAVRTHWRALLPVFAVLGAGVYALVEWQLHDSPDEPDKEDLGETFDA